MPPPPHTHTHIHTNAHTHTPLCSAGKTIAGTTDSPISVTHSPAPREDDIRFIMNEVKNYLSPNLSVRRGDVEAAWSGIRPLVIDPKKKDTQSIARNHIIDVSEGNLVTIAGGKLS